MVPYSGSHMSNEYVYKNLKKRSRIVPLKRFRQNLDNKAVVGSDY